MMITKCNIVLMFAVTMMSMFGMSYCSCTGCFELAYINETSEEYMHRTRHIHKNLKLELDEFNLVKIYYNQLLREIKDLKIVKLLYAMLPDDDELEEDFMEKILLLGNNCSFGVQTAIARHYHNRLLYVAKKYEEFLSGEINEALPLNVVQEFVFLASKISKNTSKGRLQEIFMGAYYGNRLPMLSGNEDNHDLSKYSQDDGDFTYATDEEEVKKEVTMEPDQKVKILKTRHHPLRHFFNVMNRFGHKSKHATPPPQCMATEGETDTVTATYSDEVKVRARESECESDEKNHHHCWLRNLLAKLKHHFDDEHCDVETEECQHKHIHKTFDIHVEEDIDIKVTIKHSEWLTDLKQTNPNSGEGYLVYALRALRKQKIPLPKHLLKKYHGQSLTLHDRFNVWPENHSVFILYFLFNCPVGETTHHYISIGTYKDNEHTTDCSAGCEHDEHH